MVLPTNDNSGEAWYDTDGPVKIGLDATILPIWDTVDGALQIVGLYEGHIHAEDIDVDPENTAPAGLGRRSCSGWVPFPEARWRLEEGDPVWTVEQLEPLTISPSVLCRTCGNHGWIREGKWVSA